MMQNQIWDGFGSHNATNSGPSFSKQIKIFFSKANQYFANTLHKLNFIQNEQNITRFQD